MSVFVFCFRVWIFLHSYKMSLQFLKNYLNIIQQFILCLILCIYFHVSSVFVHFILNINVNRICRIKWFAKCANSPIKMCSSSFKLLLWLHHVTIETNPNRRHIFSKIILFMLFLENVKSIKSKCSNFLLYHECCKMHWITE